MSEIEEQRRKDIELVYSALIKEINEEINYYTEEINNIKNNINKYQKILDDIKNNIKYIKNSDNCYIGKSIEYNKLLPEYCHKIDILETKQKFYENIVNEIGKNTNIREQELYNNIENCKKEIDKYKSDIDKIKNAIWNNGVLGLKLDEIVNIERLKEYKIKNNAIIGKH